MSEKQFGANLVVDSLINHKVKYVFGIPGAKIDRVFDLLENEEIVVEPEFMLDNEKENYKIIVKVKGEDYV